MAHLYSRSNDDMPDLAPIAVSAITVLAIATLLTFALGTRRNIAKGNDILRWLQTGLPLIGQRTTLRWLGSSAVELNLSEARPPLQEAQVVVVLEPRDLTWLRALGRMRGRRDFVIVRARLQRAPSLEIEAGDSRGWTGGDRLRRLDPSAWEHADWGNSHIQVAHSPGADADMVRRFWDELSAASGGIWRLSVRREHPHLEVHVRLPTTADVTADRLFAGFRRLAESVVKVP